MEESYRIDLSSENEILFEGEDLLSAVLEGKLAHITHIELYQSTRIDDRSGFNYCGGVCGGFSSLIKELLSLCPSLRKLTLSRLQGCGSLFANLPQHPSGTEMNSVECLEIKYCHVSDDDMRAIGPCFTSARHLIWYMNRFDEVAFDSYVMPYFDGDNLTFENDDGWWPGCELWGDGQMTQQKGINTHYATIYPHR